MAAINRKNLSSILRHSLAVIGALATAGCEIGSVTAPATPYRAPSSSTTGVTSSASSAEVGHYLTITVTVNDKSGNGISNVTPTITAKTSGGSSSGIVSGGCNSTDTYGRASCAITSTLPGTFTVQVTSPVSDTGPQISFYQLPRSLGFVTQPACSGTGCAAATALTTQPEVELLDYEGQPVTTTGIYGSDSLNGSIALSMSGGSGTLSGTTTVAVTASSSLVESTFSGLNVNLAGTYTLTATYSDNYTGTITGSSSSFTIVGNNATQLVFSTQPASTASPGVALTTMPVVQIEDAEGNAVSYASGGNCVVTLALTSGSPSGSLLGTLSATVNSSGQASFSTSGLNISTSVGGNFYLSATASGATGCSNLTSNSTINGVTYQAAPTSSAIDVSLSGIPYQIVVTQAGSASPLNYTWVTQPIIQVLDVNGALVSSDNSTVINATIYSSPSNCATASECTLVGSASMSVSNGSATFSGLQIDGSSSSYAGPYTIAFQGVNSGIGLRTSYVYSTIQISANGLVPEQLAFKTQPTAGMSPAPAVGQQLNNIVVQTEDAGGYYCFDDNSSEVKLVFTSGNTTNGATPHMWQGSTEISVGSATLPLVASNGLVTFGSIYFDAPGTYIVTAEFNNTATGARASNSFAIASFGSPDHLVWHTQPAGADSTASWTSQPVIYVVDAEGNLVTNNNFTYTSVSTTVSTTTDTSGNTFTSTSLSTSVGTASDYVITLTCVQPIPLGTCLLSGNDVVTAVNGIASFSGMNSNQAAGTDLVLQATSSPLTPNGGPFLSNQFTQ